MAYDSKKYHHEYYLANKAKHRAYVRAWYLRNRARVIAKESWRSRLKLYGLTQAEYEKMLLGQGGVCALCVGPPHPVKGFCVDHDHETGKIRGLLCIRCNSQLGLVDRPGWEAVAKYLGVPYEEEALRA